MKKRKLVKIALLLLFPLALAVGLSSEQKILEDGRYLNRNPAGEGTQHVSLQVEAEGIGEKLKYDIELKEILLTKEQADQYIEGAIQEIEKDFSVITDKIPAKKRYQSGIVEAVWVFDPSDCMDGEGTIRKESIPKEGLIVNARVGLRCQGYEKAHYFSFLIPEQILTESERLKADISTYIDTQLKQSGKSQVELPKEINGISLKWEEQKQNTVLIVLILEVVVMVLLYLSKVEKQKEKEKKQKEDMESDYPKIVGQMTLLLGAGMTIPQAWSRIAFQYKGKRQLELVEERPAFEEMVYINRRMQEGESEREALSHMEQRIPLLSYRRLVHILLNNKSKGGDGLCTELEQETKRAYAKKVHLVRKRGEEASTKMLIPLMLMMMIVIAIVILPAWMQMAGQ